MVAISRPLTFCFLFFVAGATAGLRFGSEVSAGVVQVILLTSLGLAVGLAIRAEAVGSRTPLAVVFLLLGAGLGARSHHALVTDCRAWLADGAQLRVTGVLEASHFGPDDAGRVPLLPLKVTAVVSGDERLDGCGGVQRVRLPAEGHRYSAGRMLEVQGEWRRAPPPAVPSRWPRNPNHAGWLRVDSVAAESPAASGPMLLRLRGRSEAAVRGLVPAHAELVEALVLGRRERLDPRIRERYARAGLSHLLAISGMHVGILAGVLLLVGRVVRLSRGAVTVTTIVSVGLYLLFIGAPPSAVRAGSMISMALLAMRLQRPFEPLGLIVAAAFAILALRPATILEPGFQLSFAGVTGILIARRTILERLPGSLRSVRGMQWLVESMVVSGAAFLATAPIVAWHFGLLAPIAIAANLVAVPLLGLALVGILASSATAPLVPAVSAVFAAAAGTMLSLLGRVAEIAAELPLGHGWVSREQAVTWTAAVVLALLVAWGARSFRAPARATVSIGVLVASLLLVPVVSARVHSGAAQIEIHLLDVGQGDAVAIRSPAGRWLLIDAGPSDDAFDAGERRILPFFRAHRVQRVELMILTHPHRDHIGGAPAILRALQVGAVVEPGHAYGSPVYLDVLRSIEGAGTEWRAARSGRTLRMDGMELRFLWPDAAMVESATDANEISAVVQLRFGPFAALFTGDAYDTAEWEMIERHGEQLRSQILKAGHHGSYTSTTPEFLDAVSPELVLISAGRRNRFGHPSPEVLGELRRRGLRVARTDLDGTVGIRIDTTRSPFWKLEDQP